MSSPVAKEAATLLYEFLEHNPNTEFIRVYWLDFGARLRIKIITRKFCQELASKQGSFLTAGSNSLDKVVDTSTSAGGLKCGTDEIYPDWPTLRCCPHFPRHASIMSTVRHIGDDCYSCPRTALKRMVDQLKALDITTAIGFEIELAIFEGPLDALQSPNIATGWLDSAVFRTKYLSVLEDMVLALQESDIPVREFHPESASQGTFEIILGHDDPMQAVDDYVRAQDIIKTVCYSQGLHVTMTPRPFSDKDPFEENRMATQGAHAHISISDTYYEDMFIAGVLENLPLLCAFGMPSIDSYFRSDDAIEEGAGHWVGWGFQNRHLPVRKVSSGHWELRYADATANMYMMVATTLAAGLHGIKTKKALVWKDCQMVPSKMTEKDRADHCITTRVPRSLRDSMAILEAQKGVLAPYMGADVLQAHETVKKKEIEVVGKWTPEARRKFYIRVF